MRGALAEYIKISIHALREEGDLERVTLQLISAIFLSTPSARRATKVNRSVNYEQTISIHALREEGDHVGIQEVVEAEKEFLSTPSARRATSGDCRC